MSRADATATIGNAIDKTGTYFMLLKADAWKSRIFFDTITADSAIASGADAIGIIDNPLPQDIEYNAAQGLVTFWSNGSKLCYAVQGSSTVNVTAYDCSCKPGVLGSVIYCYSGSTITRYGITWADMSLTSQATATPAETVVALHALSATEVATICDDDGGFRCQYISGSTVVSSTGRFMFPSFVEWDGSTRTMLDMGVFSCAMKLGDLICFYISNASSGMVEGMIYDIDTGIWCDSFIVVPTDLEVSLCEFRISNGYTRNSTLYMCGQFRRTDSYTGDQPYSLLLQSTDGKHFSVDRFVLVSNIGYRFLARAGSDNKLYLGNSNRVCYAPITWVFDGTGTAGAKSSVTGIDIISFRDENLSSASLALKAGDEAYMIDTNLEEGARVQVYAGMKTTAGDEWVLYGTYIIDGIDEGYADGSRSLTFNLLNESQWKLTGLSMPFYAEIFGKSTLYEPMVEISGKMYAAGNTALAQTYFSVDFWQQEPYTDVTESIVGFSMMDGGGVSWKGYTSAFKYGIITQNELKDILGLRKNPLITGTSLSINLHCWSRTWEGGQNTPTIEMILQICDADGKDTYRILTASDPLKSMKNAYTEAPAPIAFTIDSTALVGMYIKKVGIVFNQAETYGAVVSVARADFTNNVEVLLNAPNENGMWEKQGNGSLKLPAPGRPYIMFGQKPYNAYNFMLMAGFTNTVTGNIATYAVGGGLVGHAEDAINYTAGRYNATDSVAELVVCRNGIETVLDSAAPGWTVTTDQRIRFVHKDGNFEISMYRISSGKYELVLSYPWEAADGFMYTSSTSPMKCGIYGKIGVPWFKSMGLWKGDSDDSITADGIGIDPLDVTTGFTSTGNVRMDDNIYAYSSIIAKPSMVRGPYQFRQMGKYEAPYGTGQYGMEVRDMDWTAATSLIDGNLVAVDSGANFIANGALWQVWITTDGSPVTIYGRARYYSDNDSIGRVYHMLSNRVWVTGGILLDPDIGLVSGESMKHVAGTICFLELPGQITCSYFMGAGGSDNTILVDLLSSVLAFSGARARFSGDTLTASLPISSSTLIMRDYYADGFSLTWETAAPATFTIETNIKIVGDNYEEKTGIASDTGIDIVITSLGSGNYTFSVNSTPSDTVMYALDYTSGTGAQKYKLTFHDKNVSYYQNDQWITTIAFDDLNYNQLTYVDVSASGSTTFTNVLYRELADWREAIYIDLETDGMSAISSVLQERPVESNSYPDGSIDFWYQRIASTVTGVVEARDIRIHRQIPREGASDAIVYGSKDVKTIQHDGFGKDLGFATRLMKLPNMEAGAIEATQIMLNRLYNRRRQTNLTIRPDLRIVPGDLYAYSYTLSGTGTVVSGTMYVESVSMNIGSSGSGISSSMLLRGRMND
jgi:hypothetical protein